MFDVNYECENAWVNYHLKIIWNWQIHPLLNPSYFPDSMFATFSKILSTLLAYSYKLHLSGWLTEFNILRLSTIILKILKSRMRTLKKTYDVLTWW